MFYRPEDGHGLPHDPFTSLVSPRPIGWISTIDAEGGVNLAPYSFFNAICGKPPMVGFSSEGMKHTAANIVQTREFVVNMASGALAQAMNLTSARVPFGVDEFELAGLEKAPSQTVRAPRVARAPAALECRLVSITPVVTLDGTQTGNSHIIGQVTGIYIDPDCLKDGLFDVITAGPIARLGYRDYTQVVSTFSMIRPQDDLPHP